MTREELYQTPMFKLVKRFLMRKYPWIKDVYVNSEEDIDKYKYTMFIAVDFDPEELANEKGWEIQDYVYPDMYSKLFGRDYHEAVYLSSFFKEGTSEASDLQRKIYGEMQRLQKSESLPSEFRSLDKTFDISSFKWKYPHDNTTITN